MVSFFERTASIFLPRTPPDTPDIESKEIDTPVKGSWMRGLPFFRRHREISDDQVGLLAHEGQTNLQIEQEKSGPIEQNNVLSSPNDNWITNVDIAKMGNLPFLSGMRAFASIAIQVYHLVRPGTRSASYFGSCALSIHFVQGAFLITGALLHLQKTNEGKSILYQYTHLPKFFFGRWVRLYPALVIMIIITSIWWQRRHDAALHLAKAIFRAIFKIQHTKIFLIPEQPPNPFAHTWFLDVQEAFYLSWALALPFLVMVGTKPRMIILLALCAFSFHRRLKENTFNASLSINAWKMVAGVALQLIPIPRVFVQKYARKFAVVVLAFGCLWGSSAYLHENYTDRLHRIHGDVVGVLATFAVTMAALSKKPNPTEAPAKPATQSFGSLILSYILSPLSILDAKWLDFIGRISYSSYLWQIPVMHYEIHFMSGYASLGPTCEALIIAMISTFFIEEPIRDWYRDRLQRAKMAAMIAKQETNGE